MKSTQTVRSRSDAPSNIDELEDQLSEPGAAAMETLAGMAGDLAVLGVGGKMGPTLARMARRGLDRLGRRQRVIGVSRFSQPGLRDRLGAWGVETIACDLMDQRQLDDLPNAENVLVMTGMKFGASEQGPLTWAMNAYLPGMICQRFHGSRIVAFSSGNVYPLAPVHLGGSLETDPPAPVGEYAGSVLGRERIYQHFSHSLSIPIVLLRLNYANEPRYGVLVDMARRILAGETIDLAMGNFNAIWQADANSMALAALAHTAVPPLVLNLTGPETLSVRRVAQQLGRLLDRPVHFTGAEAGDALLSNAQHSHQLFGYPSVTAGEMIERVAQWVGRGGQVLDKPTHFETRDGRY